MADEARLVDILGGEEEAAGQRGPCWADPLTTCGEVLASQGKWRAALAKYDEALKCAPAWEALKQPRNAAAQRN